MTAIPPGPPNGPRSGSAPASPAPAASSPLARRPLAPSRVQLGFGGLLAGTSPPRRTEAPPPNGSGASPTPHRTVRPKSEDEGAPKDGRASTTGDELLDPLYRQGALLVPTTAPGGAPPPTSPVTLPSPAAMPSLEELVPQLVRKLALAGDGRRATVRVELGSGPLAGATVVVSNESGAIRVDVEAPSGLGGAERAAWSERIRSRLEARGLTVENVAVG